MSEEISATQPPSSRATWIMIVELLCIIVFLILIFGVLNFFNILQVSKAFPALSFLPRINNQQAAINLIFQQNLLGNVQTNYLPTSMTLVETPQSDVPETFFQSTWTRPDATLSTKLYYDKKNDAPSYFSITIEPTNMPSTNSGQFISLFRKYLLASAFSEKFSCPKNQGAPGCSYITTLAPSDVRTGITVNLIDKTQLKITACKIYKNSSFYNTTFCF